jgi:hypothetical protein
MRVMTIVELMRRRRSDFFDAVYLRRYRRRAGDDTLVGLQISSMEVKAMTSLTVE